MTPQASFDLSHELFGEAQVLQSPLQGLGGLLRLAAVTLQALLGFEVATLSSFGVFFGVSCAWSHGALLRSVGVFCN
ncbi:MAG: hypothetical protein ACRERE_42350 [Candidatus Entotheonellia bacterium]